MRVIRQKIPYLLIEVSNGKSGCLERHRGVGEQVTGPGLGSPASSQSPGHVPMCSVRSGAGSGRATGGSVSSPGWFLRFWGLRATTLALSILVSLVGEPPG